MKSCFTRPALISAASCRMLFAFGLRANSRTISVLPKILERGIDSVNEQLHHDRLMRAGQNQTRTRFRNEIVGGFGQPLIVEARAFRSFQRGEDREQTFVFCRGCNFSGERMRNGRNLARRTTQAMIRHRAGERETILHHVEPVHRVFGRSHATSRSESAHRSEIAFTATGENRYPG